MPVEVTKPSQNLIKTLLLNIEAATQNMSTTFEDTVLRHEDQFIKCYRIKVQELVKLLEELKGTIEDKFINNTLALQLDTVLKERDYFKYECLKLNSQHQTLLDDHKNLNAQANNANQQMAIYKHLLQTQKIKSSQVQKNVDLMKKNLSEIALKSMPQTKTHHESQLPQNEKEMIRLRKEIRGKNEIVRALREKVQDLQRLATLSHSQKMQTKEMYELWRVCVEGWQREVQRKGKNRLPTLEQMSALNKKQLLRTFFSHGQFLKLIERLMFDPGFRVVFESSEENFMEKNRAKLLTFMTQKRVCTSHQRRM